MHIEAQMRATNEEEKGMSDCNMTEMTAAALARIAAQQSSDPATDDLTVPLAIECAEKDVEIERLRGVIEKMTRARMVQKGEKDGN